MKSYRLPFGLVCAAIILLAASALWLNKSLNGQWHKGFAAGQADVLQRQNNAIEKHRKTAEALRAASDRRVVELEQLSENLQKKLAALSSAVGAKRGHSSSCLSPDVLRALAEIGSAQPNSSTGASQSD